MRPESRDGALVAAQAAVEAQQVRALAMGREGVDAKLPGELGDPLLSWPDPLTAHLDDLAVANGRVDGPSSDSVARLEDHHSEPLGYDRPRGGEPGKSRPDHHDIRLEFHPRTVIAPQAAGSAGPSPDQALRALSTRL